MPGGQARVAQATWLLAFPRAWLVNIYIPLTLPTLKKKTTKKTTQRIPQMSLCGAPSGPSGGFRYLHIALLLSTAGTMEETSADRAGELGSTEGWNTDFRSGFHKRRGLRLHPWARQLVLEGRGSKWSQPLWSPCSSSPLLFLYSH